MRLDGPALNRRAGDQNQQIECLIDGGREHGGPGAVGDGRHAGLGIRVHNQVVELRIWHVEPERTHPELGVRDRLVVDGVANLDRQRRVGVRAAARQGKREQQDELGKHTHRGGIIVEGGGATPRFADG